MIGIRFYAEKKRTFKVIDSRDIVLGTDSTEFSKHVYQLKAGVSPNDLEALYTIVHQAAQVDSRFLISLQRFNSFLTRTEFDDRIIDLTISLETMIPGKDELRYRFSLYLAYITEPDASLRRNRFKLFRDLYDTRSRIVHGDSGTVSPEQLRVQQNLEEIKKAASTAIGYYALFLNNNTVGAWNEHLNDIVIGGGVLLTQ